MIQVAFYLANFHYNHLALLEILQMFDFYLLRFIFGDFCILLYSQTYLSVEL